MEVILKFLLLLGFVFQLVSSQVSTFSNPIVDFKERDAVILKVDDYYYLAHTDWDTFDLKVLKSPYLTDFRNAEQEIIYRLPAGYTSFYPTQFISYKDDVYLYFHLSNLNGVRMFAIKADNPKNPMGRWSTPVRVVDHVWNNNSTFGATFQLNNQLYFVWTENFGESIYIAQMLNPTKIIAPAVLLREPTEDWECFGRCSLFAPAFLYNREKVYMVFTTGNETYMSYISIKTGLDPLNKANWEAYPGPVFQGNDEENVYQTRFPEFTTSPDGTETWMLYTASSNSTDLRGSSRIRIEKIEWNKDDGSPIFPQTRANGFQQLLPGGEPSKYYNPVSGNITAAYINAYRVDDYYYTVAKSSDKANNLKVLKSDKLYDYVNAEESVVYTAEEGLVVVGGRIIEIGGEAYLYFSTHNAERGWWLYVSKGENSSNLLQNWGHPTRLLDNVLNGQGLFANVFQQNNQSYLVWSYPNSDGTDDIYIASMNSPTEIVEPIVLLKEPKQTWECFGRCSNST